MMWRAAVGAPLTAFGALMIVAALVVADGSSVLLLGVGVAAAFVGYRLHPPRWKRRHSS